MLSLSQKLKLNNILKPQTLNLKVIKLIQIMMTLIFHLLISLLISLLNIDKNILMNKLDYKYKK